MRRKFPLGGGEPKVPSLASSTIASTLSHARLQVRGVLAGTRVRGEPTVTPARTHTIATNGIRMSVTEQGEGPAVVLCHGFPELAYSWRHQLPALAAAGFPVIAPDQRGYGRSSRPDAIEDYDIDHLTGDLVGLLDALGEERAVFVGHDWGSLVVSSLAMLA